MKSLNCLLAVLLLAAAPTSTLAQDKQAQAILDEMSSKYRKISAYRAKFKYELRNNTNGKVETMEGTITVKGNKYHLKLNSQEIFNNEKTTWTYIPDEKEVVVSKSDDNEALSPSKIYQIYRSGFKYAFFGEEKVGNALCYVIVLEPEDGSRKKYNFVQCRLFIDKVSKTLKRWEITEIGNLSKTTVTINDFVVDNKIKDAEFVFDKTKYPGVRIEELR